MSIIEKRPIKEKEHADTNTVATLKSLASVVALESSLTVMNELAKQEEVCYTTNDLLPDCTTNNGKFTHGESLRAVMDTLSIESRSKPNLTLALSNINFYAEAYAVEKSSNLQP